MSPDRATVNFLNQLGIEIQKRGKAAWQDGAVRNIFGSPHTVRATVQLGPVVFRTTLKKEDGRWSGETLPEDHPDAAVALGATMFERVSRRDKLPSAPNEIGDSSLRELIERELGRELEGDEDAYLDKIEKRYRRYEIQQEIHHTDLVRLHPRWPIDGYDALELWPRPPGDVLEFWNYIAYAFDKRRLAFPEFLRVITDEEGTARRMRAWERDIEIGEWRKRIGGFSRLDARPGAQELRLRLQVTTTAARLQCQFAEQPFRDLDEGSLADLISRHEAGALHLDLSSQTLWGAYLSRWQQVAQTSLRLSDLDNCRWLGRMFSQPGLREHIVTLDGEPFLRPEVRVSWRCVADEGDDGLGSYRLSLTIGDELAPHSLRVLPGSPPFYLGDDAIFEGPIFWGDDTEIDPVHLIPAPVLDSEDGVAFLYHIGAELPAALRERVVTVPMRLVVRAALLDSKLDSASQQAILTVSAYASDGSRSERLGKDGWEPLAEEREGGQRLRRFDRGRMASFPELLEPLKAAFDPGVDGFKLRLTKKFPERFEAWLRQLPEDIEVELDPALASLRRPPLSARVSFDLSQEPGGTDWFDLQVNIDVEELDLAEDEIRELVGARGDFVRLRDGTWRRLDLGLNPEQQAAAEQLGVDVFDLSGTKHRMHLVQLADESTKAVLDETSWADLQERCATLRTNSTPPPPKALQVQLRPYQIQGYHFLTYLSLNSFGGILADDMGLGKTLQAIAWILWLRERADDDGEWMAEFEGSAEGQWVAPALVVCPKSVLDVWAQEFHARAPGVRVQVLRDKSEYRAEALGAEVDVLVLNYSQLRVNADELHKVEWLATVLDEGQQIKNPDSKAAGVARELRSKHKLVLSGTPIENRLLDVWSLMAFVMPGVLGSRKYFRDRFDRRKDPEAHRRLASRLRPFLLRRTKKQVARDLPPRSEEDILCDLDGRQMVLYQEEVERIRGVLESLQSEEHLSAKRFTILQGLLRLRQICCHPALIDPEAEVSSAKLDALFYLLEQLREEGHKVLVFSQFVKMLDIIKARLEREGYPYSYLTGKTTDRRAVVEDFQSSDEPKVFLLSLKAGGSGLNLTAASYVVLYDPWWNPAVENQAIDRTHRIGQTSPVNAYRLLARNTVEEKIRALQKSKEHMSDGVLGGDSFSQSLDLAELRYILAESEVPRVAIPEEDEEDEEGRYGE
jgi:hypothetical protein